MRKRGRYFLVSVMIVVNGLLGTGYAYWQEELKLETSIHIGEIGIELVDYKLINEAKWAYNEWAGYYYAGWVTIQLGIRNNGSVPVEIKEINANELNVGDASYSLDNLVNFSVDIQHSNFNQTINPKEIAVLEIKFRMFEVADHVDSLPEELTLELQRTLPLHYQQSNTEEGWEGVLELEGKN